MSTYLIGVDIGTMGTKVTIYDVEGNVVAEGFEESKIRYPKPGWVEQDTEDFYTSSVSTIRKCIEKSKINPKDVAGIAIDGQMGGICTIDKDWNPVTHYDHWLDVRCQQYVDMERQKYGDLITKIVGMPPSTVSHAPKMLFWKNENPKIFEKVYKWVEPNVYVAGKMAGLKGDDAYIDYTQLAWSGLSDTEKFRWSEEICELLDIPVDKLPKIIEPWKIIGEVTAETAKESGLRKGIPIAAGAGDQAANFLGAGVTESGMAIDVSGTAAISCFTVDRFVPDLKYKTLVIMKAVVSKLWHAMAVISGAGLCLRWFRDSIAQKEKAEAEKEGINPYRLFDEKASKINPGSDQLLFVPHLGGRMCPSNPKIRGAWLGFTWAHQKDHFYRAILEGIAYEISYHLEVLKNVYPEVKITEVRAIGGGSKSNIWNQIKADVLNLPYIQLNREAFETLGSAVIAGYATGLFKDIPFTIKKFVKPIKIFQPRPKYHNYYKRYAQLYLNLIKNLETIYDDLFEISQIPTPQGS
jgi:xylulokinase